MGSEMCIRDRLITKSKDDSTHSRRIVFSYLKDKTAVAELFRTIAPKIADRPGGYLRILHVGFRQGDGSEMALIEFVESSLDLVISGSTYDLRAFAFANVVVILLC